MTKITSIIIAIGISFFMGYKIGANSTKRKELSKNKEAIRQKYVVIDEKGILHLDNYCLYDEHIGISYKEKTLLNREDLKKVCPYCIDANTYENIMNTFKNRDKKNTGLQP